MTFSKKTFNRVLAIGLCVFFLNMGALFADDKVVIEVGFTQDGEPEPHLLIVADGSDVLVYQLPEAKNRSEDLKKRSTMVSPPENQKGARLEAAVFNKRLKQATDSLSFFSAGQPRRKGRCKDQYVVRMQMGKKYRERRGCSNQNDDGFAGFAQNVFREAFGAWNRSLAR